MESRKLAKSSPGDIAYHVLDMVLVSNTNLTCQQAIRLSLASKELFNLVQKRSVLSYDYNASSKKTRIKKRKFLTSTLKRYHDENIYLDTFTFSKYKVDLTGKGTECIDLVVTKKGLKNLNLSLLESHDLKGPVFQAQSLVHISLRDCRLQPLEKVVWPKLKGLCLDGVRMSEEVFDNIMRSCPLVENVKIHGCCLDKPKFNFKVCNLGNLKQLNIELGLIYHTIEVMNVPNLESIRCGHTNLLYNNSSNHVRDIKRMNLPIPLLHINLGRQEYPDLKRISLHMVRVNRNFFIDFARKFPRLEVLLMEGTTNLLKFDISSPSLKEIHLLEVTALKEARLDVPNIGLFKLDLIVCSEKGVLPKVTFKASSGSGRWISQINLRFIHDIPSWFWKLKKFLSEFDRFSDTSVTAFIRDDEVLNNNRTAATSYSHFSFPQIIAGFREYKWRDWPEMDREAKRLKLSQDQT